MCIRDRIREDAQFRVIADLLGIAACNVLIQMRNSGQTLKRKEHTFWAKGQSWYAHHDKDGCGGAGRFSVDSLCLQLPDAELLDQDLKNNISLTAQGERLADWLSENGYKAFAFDSTIGGWGTIHKDFSLDVEHFKK